MNESRTFLVQLISGSDTNKRVKMLSFKVLFLMGMARQSIEDFLVICSLLKLKNCTDVDLREEIKLMRDMNN